MVPARTPASGSRFMASRSRWSMCQAVSTVTPYLRLTSRALIPFLSLHISTMTNSQIAIGTLVPWKIVPVRTENCLRHPAHFQTRRWLVDPVRVGRPLPVLGCRKYALVFPTVGADHVALAPPELLEQVV